PDVPHLQGADRAGLARTAVEELDSEVLVLDDGFQHRRLRRDLDVVLVDATEPWGQGHLLPRGLLREPRSGLRRADVVVLTRAYPDHHAYTRADVDALRAWGRAAPPGGMVVTTQKDLVKLRASRLGDRPLWALRVRLNVEAGEGVLHERLEAALAAPTRRGER